MKVYRGQRTSWNARVTVTEGDQTWTLRHEERHSPNGFDWGQRDRGIWGGGIRRGGAADLALALLLAVTDRRTAEAHYQDFAYEVLERLPRHDGWEMAESEISGWLAARQPSSVYGAAHR
jgi:hypothetical protein